TMTRGTKSTTLRDFGDAACPPRILYLHTSVHGVHCCSPPCFSHGRVETPRKCNINGQRSGLRQCAACGGVPSVPSLGTLRVLGIYPTEQRRTLLFRHPPARFVVSPRSLFHSIPTSSRLHSPPSLSLSLSLCLSFLPLVTPHGRK
ncbi:hypothetical protein ALC57_11887, partial [Trachymyrmex cornetzi]